MDRSTEISLGLFVVGTLCLFGGYRARLHRRTTLMLLVLAAACYAVGAALDFNRIHSKTG